MPEVTYPSLPAFLKKEAQVSAFSVFLLWGEESLCKDAVRRLIHVLLPEGEKSFNFERIEGSGENIVAALQGVNTYALLGGGRVVLLTDVEIFHSGGDRQEVADLPEKIRRAFDKPDMATAARLLLRLLKAAKLPLADCTPDALAPFFATVKNPPQDAGWLAALLENCRRQDSERRVAGNAAALLQEAIESGFPAGNRLILTAERVHRRRRLYRCIVERGVVVDCSVPQGNRVADKKARQAMLQQKARAMLSDREKTMDANAMAVLQEMTGFDLRTFSHNLEKLISFTGKRKTIQAADVREVLTRTRKDPLYDFTDAVSRRSLDRALFLLDSLLADGAHPLQLHMALVNQIRKLLVARDFIASPDGAVWNSGMNYGRFQARVLPALKNFDRRLEDLQHSWGQTPAAPEKPADGKKSRPAGKTAASLSIGGAHAYAVFLLLQKCSRFKTSELIEVLLELQRTEMRLKRSGGHPQRLLEGVIFKICGVPVRDGRRFPGNRQPPSGYGMHRRR